jgi:hypothetical protein
VSMSIRGGRVVAAGALTALAGLVFGVGPVSAAHARDFARITNPPSIPAQAAVGQTLTATGATWETSKPPQVSFRWVRCADTDSWSDCELIPGAEGTSYKVTADDLDQHLLVSLQVRSGNASANSISNATDAVTKPPAPPAPAPSPSPSPAPGSNPPSGGTPTPPAGGDLVPPDATTPAAPAGGVAGEHAAALKRLSPFPVVRIKGYLTRWGAQVTMLTVRAPRGARITVRCTGAGCPRKRFARATKLVHLKPYQRLLRGNLKLVISVTRRGYVGKQTVIRLRHGKAPTRRDLCLFPGVRNAKSCSAAA